MAVNPAAKGLLTSEFWVTAVTTGVSLLVATGKVSADAQDPLVQNLDTIIGLVIAFLSTFAYHQGRVELKKELLNQSTTIEEEPVTTPVVTAPATSNTPAQVTT